MSGTVDIRRGSVYLSAELYDTYFAGIAAVILLIEDGALLILPVHQMTAGGCLLKVRNARGDRVASAPDLFDARGFPDFAADGLAARWSAERCALVVPLAHKSEN